MIPGQSSHRSRSSSLRLRRNRLIYEGPEADDDLAVLDRRLRVPATEGMAREEAILEEPVRRHGHERATITHASWDWT